MVGISILRPKNEERIAHKKDQALAELFQGIVGAEVFRLVADFEDNPLKVSTEEFDALSKKKKESSFPLGVSFTRQRFEGGLIDKVGVEGRALDSNSQETFYAPKSYMKLWAKYSPPTGVVVKAYTSDDYSDPRFMTQEDVEAHEDYMEFKKLLSEHGVLAELTGVERSTMQARSIFATNKYFGFGQYKGILTDIDLTVQSI